MNNYTHLADTDISRTILQLPYNGMYLIVFLVKQTTVANQTYSAAEKAQTTSNSTAEACNYSAFPIS
jgi:hypothetical protein